MTKFSEEHIISLDRFAIGHHKGVALLDQINLSVHRGEMVALIGRNGTGKSTLLKSMIGLLAPMGGSCLLEGKPFHAYTLPERARKISFVSSQLTQLPALTVEELVGLGRMPYTGWMGGLSEEDRVLIRQALDEVQMGSFAERKLDCLSDGERQRAMIARAFVQDTALMVLDEPTAFLDIPNTYDLIALLSRFRDGGRSIVYSTHDLETAVQCADKMWVIHEGSILEGAPEDLGLSGLFSDLFATSGIRYDEHAGKFLISPNQKGSIALEGDGEELLIWTRNALERLGYSLDPGAEKKVVIASSAKGPRWILQESGGATRFENLYSMARFLVQEQ
jgi:iron complex transport system ATP-binding protein